MKLTYDFAEVLKRLEVRNTQVPVPFKSLENALQILPKGIQTVRLDKAVQVDRTCPLHGKHWRAYENDGLHVQLKCMAVQEDDGVGTEIFVRNAVEAEVRVLPKGTNSLFRRKVESFGKESELLFGSAVPVQDY